MRIESEKTIERQLVKLVKANDGMCIKMLCNQMIGLPDRLCLFKGGKVAFAELKTTGQKPRPVQIHVHNGLRALGFRVEIIDTLEGVKQFINSIV